MGLSCDGREEEMMVLFSAIEAKRDVRGVETVLDVSEKSGNRGSRELKQLECLVNYDGKGGQSSWMSGTGRDGKGYLSTQK